MNIGVFGGSFDPIHYGHLLLAQQCLDLAKLDKILFVPAAKSPLKATSPIADNKARLEMLQLAIADHPNFEISNLEMERGGTSYTVDTLRQLKELRPADSLYLLIGLDSLADLGKWREPEEIVKLAELMIVDRNTSSEFRDRSFDWKILAPLVEQQRIDSWQESLLATQRFDFSSTDLRNRIAEGKNIRYRTSRAVEKYIETQNLYKKVTA